MKHRIFERLLGTLVLAFAILTQFTEKSPAAEQAKGTYLLGAKGPQAGMLPPPGVFASNLVYIYGGDVSPSVAIPIGGNLTIGADVSLVIDAPSLVWVPDTTILGGHLAVFGLVPIGNVDVDVLIRKEAFIG